MSDAPANGPGPCGEPYVCKWCQDGTYNSSEECRDCNIARMLDEMQCSKCERMRYTRDEKLAPIAASFWGERCECPEPQPPSKWEVERPELAP